MATKSRLSLALKGLDSRSASRQRLTECFNMVLELPHYVTTTEFAKMCRSLDVLWDAAWNRREEWRTPTDIQLAANTAIKFVERCYELGEFRPWGSNYLPHLLLYCAVEGRDTTLPPSLIQKLHDLMSLSPKIAPAFAIDLVAFLTEISKGMDFSSIVTLLLNILNDSMIVGWQLYTAMVVAKHFFISPPLLDYTSSQDVLDALEGAVERSYEEGPKIHASILLVFCDFFLDASECKHSVLLLSGRYDIFTPLADCMEIYSEHPDIDEGDPIKLYGTFCGLLRMLGIVLTASPKTTRQMRRLGMTLPVPKATTEFVLNTREVARTRITALIEAVRDAKYGGNNDGILWAKTLLGVADLAVGIGAHPFCTNYNCEFHFRPLPDDRAFKRCTGCSLNALYCSPECQKVNWKVHKDRCGKKLKAT